MQCRAITPTTVLSLILWSLSRVSVGLVSNLDQNFWHLSALVRSCPPSVDKVHASIVNYKPAGTQRYPQSREFIRECDGRVRFIQIIRSVVAGNIPVSRYSCDTDFISVHHLIEPSTIVVHRPGDFYTTIQCFDGRLAVGKYCNSPLVNIFVHNNFHRRLNFRHFRLKDAAATRLLAIWRLPSPIPPFSECMSKISLRNQIAVAYCHYFRQYQFLQVSSCDQCSLRAIDQLPKDAY